jgi:hypothetical protein
MRVSGQPQSVRACTELAYLPDCPRSGTQHATSTPKLQCHHTRALTWAAGASVPALRDCLHTNLWRLPTQQPRKGPQPKLQPQNILVGQLIYCTTPRPSHLGCRCICACTSWMRLSAAANTRAATDASCCHRPCSTAQHGAAQEDLLTVRQTFHVLCVRCT